MGKSYHLQFFYLLLFIAGGLTIFGSLSLLLVQIFHLEPNSRLYLYLAQSISSFGVFFAPALLFSFFATKKWFSYSEADRMVSSKLVTAVLALSLFLLPIIACLGYLNEQFTLPQCMQKIETWMREMEEVNKIVLQTLTANSTISVLLLNIVVMALFPALFEEFLFRGTLQPFFTKWFAGKHIAIIVTAFVFSAIHLQFFGFLPRFLLGIYLGYLFVWGKSLWLPVVAHFMHNALSIIFDYFAQRNGMNLEELEPEQITVFYPVVLCCVVCVIFGVVYLWKKSKKEMLLI